MLKEENKKRILWADLIRIIAIYMVVQIHTSSVFNNSFFIHGPGIILSKLTVVSVPLFVMLSGALLLGKQENYKTFYRKRGIKVFIPWIIWTCIYMYFNLEFRFHDQIISEFFSDNQTSWVHYFIRTFLSSLWFLPLIFGLYVLTPLLRVFIKYAKNIDMFYFILLWFLIFSVLPFLFKTPLFPDYEPSIFFASLQYVGYFVVGYILFQKKIFKEVRLHILFVAGILPILISLLPINHRYIQEFSHRFLDPGTVISSFFLFSFFIVLSDKIDSYIKPGLRKLIAKISGASLGIYVIHEIVAFVYMKAIYNLLPLDYMTTFFIFISSTTIVLILQKIPIIRHIVP